MVLYFVMEVLNRLGVVVAFTVPFATAFRASHGCAERGGFGGDRGVSVCNFITLLSSASGDPIFVTVEVVFIGGVGT